MVDMENGLYVNWLILYILEYAAIDIFAVLVEEIRQAMTRNPCHRVYLPLVKPGRKQT